MSLEALHEARYQTWAQAQRLCYVSLLLDRFYLKNGRIGPRTRSRKYEHVSYPREQTLAGWLQLISCVVGARKGPLAATCQRHSLVLQSYSVGEIRLASGGTSAHVT